MNRKKDAIFLGTAGKCHGPFTQEQVERLRLSGEIERYPYQWDPNTGSWRPIAPPPVPAEFAAPNEAPHSPNDGIDAICHNFVDVVSGQLENLTDGGCDLVSPDPSDSPRLALRSPLVLSLVSSDQDHAVNVKASLAEVTRHDGRWVYHLRWARRPTF